MVFISLTTTNLIAKTSESAKYGLIETAQELDTILDDLLNQLKNTHEQFNLALEKEDYQKAAKLQCKKFDIYKKIIDFTHENNTLDRSEKYGAAAEVLLKRETINLENSKMTKYLTCK